MVTMDRTVFRDMQRNISTNIYLSFQVLRRRRRRRRLVSLPLSSSLVRIQPLRTDASEVARSLPGLVATTRILS